MSRPATSRLKTNPPLGMRPSLEFRRLNELHIDPSYQRSIEAPASQTLIRRIAMYWDWSLCQPLAIAKRADGALMVVDGQHRLEAARLRRDIDDLPCVVTAYPSAGDEAAAFVALNQQRRPLNRVDMFKAALVAGDEMALQIMAEITESGLSLAPHGTATAWKPGQIWNIGGLYESWRSSPRATALALKALEAGFKGQVLRYAGTIYPGISGFILDELRIEGRVDLAALAAVLGATAQKTWVSEFMLEAAASGVDRRRGAKNVIARAVVAAKTGRAVVRTPPPTAALPPATMLWCEQCDQQVSGAKANACASPFCKARAKAA